MEREPLVSIRGLTVRFGGLTALDALDVDVLRGEVLGLLGPNGSGKTTLFNVLTGIYRASSGTIRLADQDIVPLGPQAIHGLGVARTFQRLRLSLALTVFDNIVIGDYRRLEHGLWFNLVRRRAMRQQYDAAVGKVRDLLELLSPHLVTRMFEPAESLAMIDRRRIEVCRALIGGPRLLLLDEPSAGMTHDETAELMGDILEVRRRIQDLTVVLVEHEMGVIERVSDRCVVLNYGRKIAEGTYAQVTADRQVHAAYLGDDS